jgi:hypothetical protein
VTSLMFLFQAQHTGILRHVEYGGLWGLPSEPKPKPLFNYASGDGGQEGGGKAPKPGEPAPV